MKKILLGVIALTSAASFGAQYEHLHGYLELDAKASIEKPVSYEKKGEEVVVKDLGDQTDVTYGLGAKGDLGVFMHENKEVFAFIGTDLNGTKVGADALALGNNTPYYFGLRWDSEIIDTFNIQLTAAHRRGGKNIAWEKKMLIADEDNNPTKEVIKNNGIDKAIKKHLAAKGKKDDLGTDQGYKLGAKDTFLLSAVLNGKIYNNFDLTVAGLYNSEDFKNGSHELETYVKTNGMLKENVKIANAEIKHILKSENYEKAGKLLGDVKIETKASDVVSLSNEGKFELDSILKGDARKTTVELLNHGEYTGIKNVDLRGDVNYKLTIEEAAAETTLTHEPEVKLGVTFKPVKGLEISSDNSNKVTYKHKVVAKTNDEFKNNFTTENKIKYNLTKGMDIHTLAKYDLETNLKTAATADRNSHTVLAGAGLSVDKEVAGVKVMSTLEGRYVFKGKSVDATQAFKHKGFVWTENKVGYDFNENNKLEANLNLYNFVGLETKKENTKHVLDAAKPFGDVFLANVAAKYTNMTGKFTNEVSVDAKYGLDAAFKPNASLKHGVGIDFAGSTSFKATDNVSVKFGVENNYKFNEFNPDVYDLHKNFIKKAADGKDTILEFAKDQSVDVQGAVRSAKDMIHNIAAENPSLDSKQELSVNPKLDVMMTYVDGKLTVNPWVGAGFSFANKGGEPQAGFALRNIEGKGGIKVNYVW